MNLIRALCLALVAGIAATAFVGAPAASASTLCEAEEEPCMESNRYSNGAPISGTLVEPVEFTNVLKEPTVECGASEFEGELTNNNTTGEAEEQPSAEAEITSMTMTECTNNCQTKWLQLPYIIHYVQGMGGNGFVYWGEHPSGGQPGYELFGAGCFFNKCIYKATEAQPGFKGEWMKFSYLAGNPPTIFGNRISFKSVNCGPVGWTGNLHYFANPAPGWVYQTG